jgi:hypothetical protein
MAFLGCFLQLGVRDLVEKKQQRRLITFSSSMVEEENLIELTCGEYFASKCCLSCSWSCILWCSSFIILEHTFCNCHLKMWLIGWHPQEEILGFSTTTHCNYLSNLTTIWFIIIVHKLKMKFFISYLCIISIMKTMTTLFTSTRFFPPCWIL